MFKTVPFQTIQFSMGTNYKWMAQSRAESTRDTYNYGQYINQFPPNTIKVIREFERIQKRICRHKMSIMFNEICIYIYIERERQTDRQTDRETQTNRQTNRQIERCCVCVCACVSLTLGFML